uniref:Serine/threonine-protein phosphatase n=1 Tax=Entamoeba histolytica TaxID=5759 RepID=A0A060N4X3_ENTHI|nr:serine/threonine protein phosphatase PP1-2, putative [Entamoeba histolytica]
MQDLSPERLDAIISKCFQERSLFPGKEFIKANEIKSLCSMAIRVIAQEPSLLQLKAPIYVIGDLHGQFTDLLRYFDETKIDQDRYLFLGDYVDRGFRSIEIVVLVFALKVKYPDRFFLLRGNHEAKNINHLYGFFDECKRRFDVDTWRNFCEVFRYLPVSALIEGKILCLHGGLSKDMQDVSCLTQIARPTDIPEEGLLCDILWADPSTDTFGWEENMRGVSYTFGPDVALEFLKRNGIELLCRAHPVVEEGFKFCFNKKVLTLFSAPNYCNSFNNCGAMMRVDENLYCTFITLNPEGSDSD